MEGNVSAPHEGGRCEGTMCLRVMCQPPGRALGGNNFVQGNESAPREGAGREQFGGG